MSGRLPNGVRLLDNRPCLANINRIDMNALPMIAEMQATGLQVDLSHFAKMEVELNRDMDRITESVRSMTGQYCNLNSGDQVADLLFKKIGLKQAKIKLTRSGDRESVEDAVLTAIQHEHPVVGLIQEFKEFSKLKGTYVVPMPKLARRTSFGKWRMYPNFRTTRVPSGRLACSDPNLLAMPTRTERGRDVRKGFITDEGWVIVSVDESQIEPRIATYRSQDPALISVYQNSEDIYSDFATAAFKLEDKRYKDETGWHYPTVSKDQHRRPAKTCVLAAIYDVTGGGLQDQMPVICANCDKEATKHTCGKFRPLWTENKCQDLINAFYMKYPGLMQMRKLDHQMTRRNAYICDCWGRLLHVTAARSVLEWVVSGALREAANFPIQSAAQGTLKIVMAAIHDDWEEMGLQGIIHPILQVHDELLFECRQDVALEWAQHVKDKFETLFHFKNVPIVAEYATAHTWGHLPK